MAILQNRMNMRIGTVNGTGSQSSNQIIMKSIFRMGIPVSGKNLFPSNIYGLPTWFHIRISDQGYTSFLEKADLVVAMNKETVVQDIASVEAGGVFIFNSDFKFDEVLLRADVTNFGISFKEIVKPVSDSIKLKKLLTNMIYVGLVAKIIGIDIKVVEEVVSDFFKSKASVVEVNISAIRAGFEYAELNFSELKVPALKSLDQNSHKVLMDGNTAGALGAVYGGCSFASWYPITPSSSLMEEFEKKATLLRSNEDGSKNFAVVQAEDELASIGMVLGAGWAGVRAMTATSGPGMSLMSEFIGLSYFAEVPAVIWNIQRVGPSTGLPTRTQQGDLRIARTMGHGDGSHPVLLPANPEECFFFGALALNLAEDLQTFVCVLSDLDIGMNAWVTEEFSLKDVSISRGKVFTAEQLAKIDKYERYADRDGDGIPTRTLPGTHHDKAAFFTRGTGHRPDSTYSEDNTVYEDLMKRLERKEATAKEFVPKPVIETLDKGNDVGLIAYGSTDQAMQEARDLLKTKNCGTSYMRIRALPFTDEVERFLENHKNIIVIDQNRDSQMLEFLSSQYRKHAPKLTGVTSYDGLPVRALDLSEKILVAVKEGDHA